MKTKFILAILLMLSIVSVFLIIGCEKEKINQAPTITISNPVNNAPITLGDNVIFSANASDADGRIKEVQFFIDAILKKTVSTPPYKYEWNTTGEQSGNRILKVTAYDNEDLSVSAQLTISLGSLPIVDFSSDKTNDTVPLTVNFTDLTTNNPTSWSWSFGDGGTSTERNPSHTYSNEGSFTVSLSSTNDYGESTITKEDYIIGGSVVNTDFTVNISDGIVPLTVNFTDASTNAPISWMWDFGDGSTSTDQNPSHTFDEVGSYTISLTATNQYGSDVEIKNDFIKGGAIPDVDFSESQTNGIAPLTVEFNDLSTQSPSSWSWDFGDGNTSTDQNPTNIFKNEGTYTVTLTSTNDYGSASQTKHELIVVGSIPTSSFSASPTNGVVPLTVNFVDESTENTTSWSWDFGDGGTSTEQNPSYTYGEAGKYNVTLTSLNEYGSVTIIKDEYINVLDVVPEISVIDIKDESEWDYWIVGKDDYYYIQSNNDIPVEVLFHSSEANKDYTIYFNEDGILDKLVVDGHIVIFGNFNGQNVDVGVIYSGGETEVLRGLKIAYNWDEMNLKSTKTEGVLNRLIGTVAEFVSGIPCVLASINELSTIGLESSILQWTCGNNLLRLSIDLADQEIILHDGSANFINLYDINSTGINCENSEPLDCIASIASAARAYVNSQLELLQSKASLIEQTLIELYKPIAAFTANKTSASAPVEIRFSDQSTNAPSIWFWEFGDGETSDEQNPSHTYENPGAYTVSLTVSNEFGTDKITKNNFILLINLPDARFTANKTTGAVPLTVSFTDQSTENPTNWEWNFGDGNSSTEQNPSHTYSTAGSFTVSLTVNNIYGTDTETKENYITTGNLPITGFTANTMSGTTPLTVDFTDQTTNSPTSWAWNFGDGNTSTEQNPSHTYNSVGEYTVSLNVTNIFGADIETKLDYISVTADVNHETGTVSDYEGNVYNTVKIGDQWWMAENFAATKFNDGTDIPYQNDNSGWQYFVTEPAYDWYDDEISFDEFKYKNTYGALYNWYAVNTNKLCPNGWHVPFNSEWTKLTDYLGGSLVSGGKLKESGDEFWMSPNTGATNETGFTALPGGNRTSNGSNGRGSRGVWWSNAVMHDAARGRALFYTAESTDIFSGPKTTGSSVRCVKDDIYSNIPPETDFAANNVTGIVPLTVYFNDQSTDNVSSWLWDFGDGNISTDQNPVHIYIAAGVYTVSLTATNFSGADIETKLDYISVTTDVNHETGTVSDYEGNVYNTVKIGDQWWMAENLAATKYNDGLLIPNITSNTEWSNLSEPAYCWYNNNEVLKASHGALYNWYTVETAKLCPTDWHVPLDEEWKKLEMSLGMSQDEANSQYYRGTDEGSKLKEIFGWNGNGYGSNESGFSALPSGYRHEINGNFYNSGYSGKWFTSSEYPSSNAFWSRELVHEFNSIYRQFLPKKTGLSVRCIKD